MIFPFLMGAAAAALWLKHSGRAVDYCKGCKQPGQIGKYIRYLPTESNVQIPYCKKCKPEIFPKSLLTRLAENSLAKESSSMSDLIPEIFTELKQKFIGEKVKIEHAGEVHYASSDNWTNVADELVAKQEGVPKVSFVNNEDIPESDNKNV